MVPHGEKATEGMQGVLATPLHPLPADCCGADQGRTYSYGHPQTLLYCAEEAEYLDSVDMATYYREHTGDHWSSETWYDTYIPPQPQRLNFRPPTPPCAAHPLSARAPSPPSHHYWATYSGQQAHAYPPDDTATLAELCEPATPPRPPLPLPDAHPTPLKAKAQRKRGSEDGGGQRVVRRRSEAARPRRVSVVRPGRDQVERGLRALAQQQQLQVQHMVGQHVADLLQLLLGMQQHVQPPAPIQQPEGEGEVAARRARDRQVLEGMLGPQAEWLHVEVLSGEQHERLTLRLQQHLNQVRYLAHTHSTQRRAIRAPQHPQSAIPPAQPAGGACGELSTTTETDTGPEPVAEEPPPVMHMATPLRPTPEGEDLLLSYCGHWVTTSELQAITRANLVPFVSAGAVRWMEGQAGTALASADSHVCEAYHQAITEYPMVFRPIDTRKTLISKRALAKVIAHNPAAVGLGTRRTYVEEGAAWAKDLESGVLRRSSKFFPSTSMRTPFATIEEAHEQLRRHLGSHMPPGFNPPTLDTIREAVDRGKEQGFDMWYQRFNELIFDGCMGMESEMNFFLSLLATASPNSGVYQNTLNALLNFRALSQDSRPRWGSYPARNLVNYLAGTLGAASGMKIAAFLSNLVGPACSQAVTIDTHMQRHALGVGHLSLLPHEYAILEDFYRCAANQLNENPPHRLQAAIWCTLAGPYSFREELQQCRRHHTFRLLPDQATWQAHAGPVHVQAIRAILGTPHGRRLACTLLRRKLLDIGYMSLLPDTTQDMRRSYARRQTRTLLAEEEEEAQQQLLALGVAERAGDGLIDNMEEEGTSRATQQAMQAEERDPYFKTHAHFAGSARCLRALLVPGSFHSDLAAQYAATS